MLYESRPTPRLQRRFFDAIKQGRLDALIRTAFDRSDRRAADPKQKESPARR
jgi:hypothetical protein